MCRRVAYSCWYSIEKEKDNHITTAQTCEYKEKELMGERKSKRE